MMDAIEMYQIHYTGKFIFSKRQCRCDTDLFYSSDLYTDRIENIVAEHDTKDPLFLYAGLQNVHFPLEAPQEYLDYYSWIKDHDRRVFAAMTMALDHSVGRIINSFKAKGIWDNTIVYFTTDNGGSSWYGGNNFPLRGIKVCNIQYLINSIILELNLYYYYFRQPCGKVG